MNVGDSGIPGTGTTGTGAEGSIPSAADASTSKNPMQGSGAGGAFVRGFGVTRWRHDACDANAPQERLGPDLPTTSSEALHARLVTRPRRPRSGP